MVQMPTAEEFAALQQALAEATRRSESLVGELRVVGTKQDLALERLRALQRQLFAAKSEACGTDQKDQFLNRIRDPEGLMLMGSRVLGLTGVHHQKPIGSWRLTISADPSVGNAFRPLSFHVRQGG
jgi:hypothetical protein